MSPLQLLGMLLSPQWGVELPPGSPWPSQPLRGHPNLSVCVFSPQGVQEDEPQREGEDLQTYRAAPGVGGGTQSGFSFPWKPPDFSLPVLVPPHWAHFGGLAIQGSGMAVTNPFPLATRSPSSPSTWGRGTSWTTWSPWTLWVSGVPACSKSRHFPTNI